MRNLITYSGYRKLLGDLHHYQTVIRPQVIKELENARGFGDIKENAEYNYAKDRQAQVEGKIVKLNEYISSCEVIDVNISPLNGKIGFGTKVMIENVDSGERKVYQLVGETESDIKAGKLNYLSPLGRALIGREAGEDAEVETPSGGEMFWEIIKIVD
jgi:transcription elongation factor GreA|tara:strand:- start:161 stop:634 length:474 start_codon:yes stop_codon:yes gene_type:complete